MVNTFISKKNFHFGQRWVCVCEFWQIAHPKTHTCACVCDWNFGKMHTCVRCACGRKSSVRMCVRARQKIVATHCFKLHSETCGLNPVVWKNRMRIKRRRWEIVSFAIFQDSFSFFFTSCLMKIQASRKSSQSREYLVNYWQLLTDMLAKNRIHCRKNAECKLHFTYLWHEKESGQRFQKIP